MLETETERKVIVIGIDGASYNLINYWIQQGKLETFKKIMTKGVYTSHRSCYPPVTSPNWKCYSTGKNPGKLGIFWWSNFDKKNKKLFFPRDRLFDHKEIWDYVGETGKKVIVVNMPLTYPPKKVNGILVSGPPDSAEKGFTYPKHIELILKKKFNYRINPVKIHLVREHDKAALDELLNLIKLRFEITKFLLNKYENTSFIHLTIFYVNTLHHYLWDDDYVLEAWKIIDKEIGVLIKNYPEYNFIIMSDHGSSRINSVININAWLESEGYLKRKTIALIQEMFERIGLNRENVLKILTYLRIKKILNRVIHTKLGSILTNAAGFLPSDKSLGYLQKVVDWKHTKAVALPQGPIYIMKDIEKTQTELSKRLLNIVDPITGKMPIKKVYTKYEVYSGEYIDEAPDLLIEYNEGHHILASISSKEIFTKPMHWHGENAHKGIFMAYGPLINNIGKLEKEISILDIAPTILYILGIKPGPDMDGKVIKEIVKG